MPSLRYFSTAEFKILKESDGDGYKFKWSQSSFTFSNFTIETLEQGVKYTQSKHLRNFEQI